MDMIRPLNTAQFSQVMEEQLIDDDAKLTAPEIHSYLTRIMYQRRNKMDPFWNTIIVAGVKDGKS